MNIYIYKITNLKDNSIYIGIRNIEGDIYKDKYKGECTILKRDLRKYGKKAFSTEILAKDLTEELAQMLILEYKKIFKATILEDISDKNELRKASQKGKNSGVKKKVICLNNKKIFDSATEASAFYGLKSSSVAKACGKEGRHAGVDIETGEKLSWMYYDKYIAIEEGREYIPIKNTARKYKTRPVLCETTGESFNSIKEASEFYGVSEGSISSCCSYGDNMTAGKDPETGEPLIWSYLD